MDLKTLLQSGGNRRSLLKGMGVAAIGISIGGGLAGCSKEEAKTLANGEEAKLNFYNWDTYIGETTLDDFLKSSGVRPYAQEKALFQGAHRSRIRSGGRGGRGSGNGVFRRADELH